VGGTCSTYVRSKRNCYKGLVGKPQVKGPVTRPKIRRDNNNIKMDRTQIIYKGLDRIQNKITWQNRVNTITNLLIDSIEQSRA
jgi:hypothetical protein